MNVIKRDLHKLREGAPSVMSDNRLMCLAEWLGICLTVTFAESAVASVH